jgi:hypothetical protein
MAHKLLELIDASGMTERALAKKLGVSQQAVHLWRQGAKRDRKYRVPAERVRELARVLDCDPAVLRPDLFGGLK